MDSESSENEIRSGDHGFSTDEESEIDDPKFANPLPDNPADRVIELACGRKANVFMTGPGGTGKTHTIKRLIEECQCRGIKCHATATTGAAAINFGGTTLHSFMGCGLAKGKKEALAAKVRYTAKKLIKDTEVLIIDEISMLGKSTVIKFDYVCRVIRNNMNEFFGGLVVVASGDFLQLPPVGEDFCFNTKSWNTAKFNNVVFTTAYRFDDIKYFDMLQRIRYGVPKKNDLKRLSHRQYLIYNKENGYAEDLLPADALIKPTRLFPKKKDVAHLNMLELDKIDSKLVTFHSTDKVRYCRKNKDGDTTGYCKAQGLTVAEKEGLRAEGLTMLPDAYKDILDNMAEKDCQLKVGAQVMLTWNVDTDLGLVNGSRGVVMNIFKNKKAADPSDPEYQPDHVEVLFRNNRLVKISAIERDLNIKRGRLQISRMQIPLILAYAISIHKCQGATLDCAIADLGKNVFADSMAYVAISRIRSLEGLYLSSFDEKCIRVSEDARNFMAKIEGFNLPETAKKTKPKKPTKNERTKNHDSSSDF